MATTPAQLSAALVGAGLPTPSPQFVSLLLSSQRAAPPFPAILATAKHRLLSSDITSHPAPLTESTLSFPANLSNPSIQEERLSGPIPVQVLGVEDLSMSRWEQLEAIEAQERGEMTKGREIIRVVDAEESENGRSVGQPVATSGGPHRLVLQDVKGHRVYGLELKAVRGIGMGMSIGTKLVLRNVTVARGLVLLEPGTVAVLGGRIESLHKAWLENRKKDLEAAIVQTA